jgi:glycerophosphoryl diester phosphodiesterase
MATSFNPVLHNPVEGARSPLVIAHRGASGLTPENTLAAFKVAVALGADGVELDVQLTADERPVVIHDRRVNRTTNGAGAVRGLTLDQLSTLDAGSWFARRLRMRPRIRAMLDKPALVGNDVSNLSGQRVPGLEVVLAMLNQASLSRVYIELKTDDRRRALLDAVISLVRSFGMERSVTLLSFDHEIIALAKIQAPEIRTAVTFPTNKRRLVSAKSIVREIERVCADEAALHISLATRRTVEAVHNRGLSVSVWTANRKLVMRRLIACGVDSIMTNFPDRLIHIVDSPRDRLPGVERAVGN